MSGNQAENQPGNRCPQCRAGLALRASVGGGAVLACRGCGAEYKLVDAEVAPVTEPGAGGMAAGTQPTLALGAVLESHWQKTLVSGRAATPGISAAVSDPTPGQTLKPDATILLQADGHPPVRSRSLPRVHVATASAAAGTTSGAAGGTGESRAATPVALEILSKLGEGGMGAVYRARQTALGREVALKQISAGDASGETVRLFLHEAQATGLLDHPNIVPVHELGIDTQGRVFYTMKMVRGKPWSEFLQPPKPAAGHGAVGGTTVTLDLAGHLEVLLKVIDAVAFAHDKGLLHRDLKPDNVMIGDFGEVLVVDWGLACAYRRPPAAGAGVDESMPQASDVNSPCGTPQYLPPEMALGLGAQIGPASDVYLLGAILYEVLFQRPVHQADTVRKVLRLAAQNAIVWSVPAAEPARSYYAVLEGTLKKALHTDPGERFSDAAALGRELRANLRHFDSIVLARRSQAALEQLAAAGGGARQYAAYDEALAGLRQALMSWPENTQARQWQAAGRAAYADYALQAGDLALARAQIEAAQGAGGVDAGLQSRVAALAARATALEAEATRRLQRLKLFQRGVVALAALLVIGAGIAFVWINNARTRAEEASVEAARQRDAAALQRDRAVAAEAATATARDKAVSAEARAVSERDKALATSYIASINLAGRYAAEGNSGGAGELLAGTVENLRGWEYDWVRSKAHQEAASYTVPPGQLVGAVAMHPTQALVAFVVNGHAAIRLWDARAQKEVGLLQGHTRAPMALCFSPDGRRLVSVELDSRIILWDVVTRQPVKISEHPIAWTRRPQFSADGSRYAVDIGGAIRVFDPVDGGWVAEVKLAKDESIDSFALSADGRHLMIGLYGGRLRTCALPAGTLEQECRLMEAGQIVACGYIDANEAVAVCVDEGEMMDVNILRRWDLQADEATQPDELIHTPVVQAADISANGQVVAVSTWENRLKVYRTDCGSGYPAADYAFLRLHGHTGRAYAVAVAADGRSAATAASDGTIKVWNLDDLDSLHFLEAHASVVRACGYTADGKMILTAGQDGKLRVHDATTRAVRGEFANDYDEEMQSLDIQQNGPLAVTGGESGAVRLWNLQALEPAGELAKIGPKIVAVCFRPDDRQVAYSQPNGPITVVDLATMKTVATVNLDEKDHLLTFAFSPDGASVVGATINDLVCWEVATGRPRWRLHSPQPMVIRRLVFHPAGTELATVGEDKLARLWSWQADAPAVLRATLTGHNGPVVDCVYSPDGRRLATGSYDRSVKLWDVAQGRELCSYDAMVYDTYRYEVHINYDIISREHASNVDCLAFSPDGKTLLYCKSDGRPIVLTPTADPLARFTPAP